MQATNPVSAGVEAPAKKRLTLREMGLILGCSEPTVMVRRDKGMPMDDAEAAKQWCDENLNSRKVGYDRRVGKHRDILNVHRAKKLDEESKQIQLKNELRQIELEAKRGKLVAIDEAHDVIRTAFEPLKLGLDAMPEVMAKRMTGDSAHDAESLRAWVNSIRRQMDRALEKAADA